MRPTSPKIYWLLLLFAHFWGSHQAVQHVSSVTSHSGSTVHKAQMHIGTIKRKQAGQFFTEEQRQIVEKEWQSNQKKVVEEIESLSGMEFAGNSVGVNGSTNKFLWDFFPPMYPCPLVWQVGRLPTEGDGAKFVCGAPLLGQNECVVYSFGSAGLVQFEEDIIKKAGCEVHVFDPTLNEQQIQVVEKVEGVHFHDYGLGGFDGELAVVQSVKLNYEEEKSTMAIKTLETIMQELGHKWVDILKVDIEGAEYDFLESYTKAEKELPATQFQVEFHHWRNENRNTQDIFNILRNLTTAGNMRPFHVEPNLWNYNNGLDFVEYAFLHVDQQGHVRGEWNR